MPSSSYATYYAGIEGGRPMKEARSSTWTNSPKVKGDLILRSNPHTFSFSRMISDKRYPYDRSHPWGTGVLYPNYFAIDWSRIETKTYQKLRRKLYQGSASLGVTAGSYKQSRQMIVSRSQQLAMKADDAIVESIRSLKKDGKAKTLANLHLEVIFGWMPLIQDIHAAATTVIQQAPIRKFVKVTSSEIQTPTRYADGMVGSSQTQRAYIRVTSSRGMLVTVSNPNVWLAERAGLLNPVAVAWDLVPWSFLVNMVSNIGVLVNSISDYAGLDISNGYRVRRTAGTMSHTLIGSAWGTRTYVGKQKIVTLDPITRPPLTFKMPAANWETAAMAASLFTQKFQRLARLLN